MILFPFGEQATVTAFVPVGFSFDDEPTVNSQDELAVEPPGHGIRGTGILPVRMGRMPMPRSRLERVNAIT